MLEICCMFEIFKDLILERGCVLVLGRGNFKCKRLWVRFE